MGIHTAEKFPPSSSEIFSRWDLVALVNEKQVAGFTVESRK